MSVVLPLLILLAGQGAAASAPAPDPRATCYVAVAALARLRHDAGRDSRFYDTAEGYFAGVLSSSDADLKARLAVATRIVAARGGPEALREECADLYRRDAQRIWMALPDDR